MSDWDVGHIFQRRGLGHSRMVEAERRDVEV